MNANPKPLTLGNIAGGAAEEVFGRELQAILENIADVNTPAETKRKISLEFSFSPSKDRSMAAIELKCSSKVAAIGKVDSTVFIFRSASGAVVAAPHDPRQADMFAEKLPENVEPMRPTGTEAKKGKK